MIKIIMLRYMKHYWGDRCEPRLPIDTTDGKGNQLECPLCKAWDCFDYLFPKDTNEYNR